MKVGLHWMYVYYSYRLSIYKRTRKIYKASGHPASSSGTPTTITARYVWTSDKYRDFLNFRRLIKSFRRRYGKIAKLLAIANPSNRQKLFLGSSFSSYIENTIYQFSSYDTTVHNRYTERPDGFSPIDFSSTAQTKVSTVPDRFRDPFAVRRFSFSFRRTDGRESFTDVLNWTSLRRYFCPVCLLQDDRFGTNRRASTSSGPSLRIRRDTVSFSWFVRCKLCVVRFTLYVTGRLETRFPGFYFAFLDGNEFNTYTKLIWGKKTGQISKNQVSRIEFITNICYKLFPSSKIIFTYYIHNRI